MVLVDGLTVPLAFRTPSDDTSPLDRDSTSANVEKVEDPEHDERRNIRVSSSRGLTLFDAE